MEKTPFSEAGKHSPLHTPHHPRRTQLILAYWINQNGVNVHSVATQNVGEDLITNHRYLPGRHAQQTQCFPKGAFSRLDCLGNGRNAQHARYGTNTVIKTVGGDTQSESTLTNCRHPFADLRRHLGGIPTHESVIQIHNKTPDSSVSQVIKVDVKYRLGHLVGTEYR
jgi:hypothetical protein